MKITPKELRTVLDTALTADDPGIQLERLLIDGTLADLPEINGIIRLGEDSHGLHKDVWEHTKAVVAGVPNTLELRWSALLHDIGKAKTRRIGARGRVTFHNHDVVGARMVDALDSRLMLFSGEPLLASTIRLLVLNHLRPAAYKHDWPDSAIRRLLVDLGGLGAFQRLMCLSRADLTTKIPAKKLRALQRAAELELRVVDVIAHDNAPKLPKSTMGLIMERVDARPGPWLNAVRLELEEMMKAGTLKTDELSSYYVDEGMKLVKNMNLALKTSEKDSG